MAPDAPEIPLKITRGKTAEFAFLYADEEQVFLPIEAMPVKAPARLTITGHQIPDGWPVQVQCVKVPAELNNDPNGDEPYYKTKVVDANTIEFNRVNAHCWKEYAGGGLVVFNRPVNLTGWRCRAQVRTKAGATGTPLFSWDSDPSQNPDGVAVVDVARACFVLRVEAAAAAALTWSSAVYDLEAIAPDGSVYAVTAISPITVEGEVTV